MTDYFVVRLDAADRPGAEIYRLPRAPEATNMIEKSTTDTFSFSESVNSTGASLIGLFLPLYL